MHTIPNEYTSFSITNIILWQKKLETPKITTSIFDEFAVCYTQNKVNTALYQSIRP